MADEKAMEQIPAQKQDKQPGQQEPMVPEPISIKDDYRECGKLEGKKALITGGDSGIGRAVAVHFAREGADVAIVYLSEHEDARESARLVEEAGRRAVLIAGDVADEGFCRQAIQEAVDELGGLNILVNNAAEQHPVQSLEELSTEQWDRTFKTNIYAYFFMAKAALPHMGEGDSIINTASVTAYEGNETLIDYSATKGAIVTFTRSLSLMQSKNKSGIRVNGVAPGPIWTPLIPASFSEEKVKGFGSDRPMGRAGHPAEVAPCYVFLASDDASYISGQMLHPNGGQSVNG
jgi:NAD(P)-dependent dehydrogenase (short-subunit alcohol dehydrogenase family)